MGDLTRGIEAAEELHGRMHRLGTRGGEDDHREIVKLRGQFSKAVVNIMALSKENAGLAADPDKQREFHRRFSAMRGAMVAHQGRWLASSMARDAEGYRQAAAEVGRIHAEFFDWARMNLRGY